MTKHRNKTRRVTASRNGVAKRCSETRQEFRPSLRKKKSRTQRVSASFVKETFPTAPEKRGTTNRQPPKVLPSFATNRPQKKRTQPDASALRLMNCSDTDSLATFATKQIRNQRLSAFISGPTNHAHAKGTRPLTRTRCHFQI